MLAVETQQQCKGAAALHARKKGDHQLADQIPMLEREAVQAERGQQQQQQ